MKRIKPSERNPRPNQVVSIVATSIIRAGSANNRSPCSFPKTRPAATRTERVIGKGQYVGCERKVTAFVWLDDEPEVLKTA